MTAVFDRQLEAIPAAPAQVRRAFRDWLRQLGWPPDDVYDLVMAVNEAATNSVEHAYLHAGPDDARPLRVHAELAMPSGEVDGLRHIVVEVADAGRWRLPPAEPGKRGRGLRLMRSSTTELRVQPGPSGTTVRMVSRPAHPAALSAREHRLDQALHRHTAPWPGPARRHVQHRSSGAAPRATADD